MQIRLIKPIYLTYNKKRANNLNLLRNLLLSIIVRSFALFIILGFIGVSVAQPEIVDGIVAVVNGDVITLSMLEDAINAFWDDPNTHPKSKQEALENLVDHTLKLQEAIKLGVSVSEENLALEVAKQVTRFSSQKDFTEALKRRGITQKDLEENLMDEIMIREMVNRKFRIFVEVSDIDASEYYQQHKEELIIPETVYFNQLFFQLNTTDDEEAKTVKIQAETAFEDIKKGADFSKYIQGNNEKNYIAMDVGYTSVDEISVPVVASSISQLGIGESRFIETPAGYFIIRLNDRRPVRQGSFDEAKDEIKNRIAQQKTEVELDAWLKKQRETADVRIKSY
jgi:peptidyl-prolyl cis-trans isomerase SurA